MGCLFQQRSACRVCVRWVQVAGRPLAQATCRRAHGNAAAFTFPTCAQLPPTNQPWLARNSTCLAGAERGAEAACAGRCCAVPRAGLRRHSGQRQQGGGRPRPGLPGKGFASWFGLGVCLEAQGLFTRLRPPPTRCCSCPVTSLITSSVQPHSLIAPSCVTSLTHCPLTLQISLMPQSAEPKTLGDYFPRLKLGGKKR